MLRDQRNLKGAFFGTTFPHLFFLTYRELAPAPYYSGPTSTAPWMSGNSPAETPTEPNFVNPNPYGGQKEPFGKVYVPRIYGFKVSERARCGPRMKWSRLRPQLATELDKVDWFGRWVGAGAYSDNGEDDDTNEGGQMEDFDPVSYIFYILHLKGFT